MPMGSRLRLGPSGAQIRKKDGAIIREELLRLLFFLQAFEVYSSWIVLLSSSRGSMENPGNIEGLAEEEEAMDIVGLDAEEDDDNLFQTLVNFGIAFAKAVWNNKEKLAIIAMLGSASKIDIAWTTKRFTLFRR